MAVPTSSYLPNIPQPGDLQSVSQGQILNNFGAITTFVDVNHYDFSASANFPGKHWFVGFPPQSSATPPLTNPAGGSYVAVSNEVGLFSFVNATTTQGELYVTKTNGSGVPINPPIPMTAAGEMTNGWTYLPSGIILQWGSTTLSGGSATVTFPLAFPNNVFNIQVSYSFPKVGTVPLSQKSVATVTTFTITNTTAASVANVNWFAIGN